MRTNPPPSVRGPFASLAAIVCGCMAPQADAQPHCPETWRLMPGVTHPLDTATFVTCLAVHDQGPGPAIYAAGVFTAMNSVIDNTLARGDGSEWTPLGGVRGIGINGRVNAMLEFNDGSGPALFAAGEFTSAGSDSASSIARWSGGVWSPLGGGLTMSIVDPTPGRVTALALHDDGTGTALYAGGFFGAAGGQQALFVARWNGQSWSPVGVQSLNGPVGALAEFQGELYAGGSFGGLSYIARWNGVTWSPVGAGFNSQVRALTVHDDGSGPALYAGGTFTQSGNIAVQHVARWDGSNWSPVGTGTNSPVDALHSVEYLSGPILYAGGSFTQAGSQPAKRIAQWNGSSWSPLAGGLNNTVTAIRHANIDTGPALFIGGLFETNGTPSSARIIAWAKPNCPPDLNCDGQVNFFDVTTFMNAYNNMDPIADFNGDFQFAFFDISLFLAAYNAGCP